MIRGGCSEIDRKECVKAVEVNSKRGVTVVKAVAKE